MSKTKDGVTHLVIPDTQVKPGVNTDHLEYIGNYVADRKPDHVIMLGDWWDMPSLSSYDKGTKSAEGRRYQLDVDAGNLAMDRFLAPLKRMGKGKPKLHFLMGNHEERIKRAVNADPKLAGKLSYDDLNLKDWNVYDFLEVCELDGVAYSHYFPRGPTGIISQTKRGAPSAKAQLAREGQSCTAGHAQGLDIACHTNRTKVMWGIIAGSCYQHDEAYLSPQHTKYWRGIIVKHGVQNGSYNPMFVNLDYLVKRYGK
jgi:hypothetical protein